MRLAHIVNPVTSALHSDLHVAQPITFESMRRARAFSADDPSVITLACSYPEDAESVPADFVNTPVLERSVADLHRFTSLRKLPLFSDILDRLYDATDAEYLIYSNVDIALMPTFYQSVAAMIAEGLDAFVINRRTISARFRDPADLALMYAEAGKSHPGFDCFVFRRDMVPHLDLGEVCTGAPWVGRVMVWNLCVLAERFMEFKNCHLTFHLGNDKTWQDGRYADYEGFNRSQAASVLERLTASHGPFKSGDPITPYLTPDPRICSAAPGRERGARDGGLFTRLFGGRTR